MIERIKRVVSDFHGGDKEWFLICIATGGWQFFANTRYRFDEWRIDLTNGIKIDIQDLQDGRYRVSVGTPRTHGLHRWDDSEFAATNEKDDSWEYSIRLMLADAYNDPNIRCKRMVI